MGDCVLNQKFNNSIVHFSNQFNNNEHTAANNPPKMGRELSPDTAYKNGQEPHAHGKNKSVTESFFDSFDINNLDDAKSNNSNNGQVNYRDNNLNISNKNNGNSSNGTPTQGSDNRSRQEVEIRWTCPLCTYHNNMLMNDCELCGTLKPDNPMTVKVESRCYFVVWLNNKIATIIITITIYVTIENCSRNPPIITSA